jgi:hypothetical protein
MLQTLIVFAGVLVLMTLVTAQAGLVGAKIAYQRIARSYADVALTAATGNYLSYAQEEVRKNGPDALSMLQPADPPPAGTFNACSSDPIGSESSAAQTCRFAVTVQVNVAASTQTSTGSSVAQSMQAQHVLERRVSVVVEADVVPYDAATQTLGAPVASKARYLTIRTFANAPFAALTGVRNLDAAVGSASGGQGDSAGSNADARGYRDPSDTGIHVQLDCKQGPNARGQTGTAAIASGPSLEGLPNAKGWAVEPPCDFPDQSVDEFNSKTWNAGTDNTTGWSR